MRSSDKYAYSHIRCAVPTRARCDSPVGERKSNCSSLKQAAAAQQRRAAAQSPAYARATSRQCRRRAGACVGSREQRWCLLLRCARAMTRSMNRHRVSSGVACLDVKRSPSAGSPRAQATLSRSCAEFVPLDYSQDRDRGAKVDAVQRSFKVQHMHVWHIPRRC